MVYHVYTVLLLLFLINVTVYYSMNGLTKFTFSNVYIFVFLFKYLLDKCMLMFVSRSNVT